MDDVAGTLWSRRGKHGRSHAAANSRRLRREAGRQGGLSRISVMVIRRFAAMNGSSGNNGWVSALPATMNRLVGGTPSASRIRRTLLARSAEISQAPYPGRDGRRVADV